MGRCGDCRKQTQNFCFVHQEFVCPASLAATDIHDRCVVGSYRKWVQDSSYIWPPKCPICDDELKTDDELVRLTCLHVSHLECMKSNPPAQLACPICMTPLVPQPNDQSPLALKMQKQLADAPWFPSPLSPDELPPAVGTEDASFVSEDKAEQSVPLESQNAEIEEKITHEKPAAPESKKADSGASQDSVNSKHKEGSSVDDGVESFPVAAPPTAVPPTTTTTSTSSTNSHASLPQKTFASNSFSKDDTVIEVDSKQLSTEMKPPEIKRTASASNLDITKSAEKTKRSIAHPVNANPPPSFDIEAGNVIDGTSLDFNSKYSRTGTRALDDDDKALKYRKAVYKRVANEIMRRWLSLKRIYWKHRRQILLALFLIFVTSFASWLLFGGDQSEPIQERASHNWARLETDVEKRASKLEDDVISLEHKFSNLKHINLNRYRHRGGDNGMEDGDGGNGAEAADDGAGNGDQGDNAGGDIPDAIQAA